MTDYQKSIEEMHEMYDDPKEEPEAWLMASLQEVFIRAVEEHEIHPVDTAAAFEAMTNHLKDHIVPDDDEALGMLAEALGSGDAEAETTVIDLSDVDAEELPPEVRAMLKEEGIDLEGDDDETVNRGFQ